MGVVLVVISGSVRFASIFRTGMRTLLLLLLLPLMGPLFGVDGLSFNAGTSPESLISRRRCEAAKR